MTPTEFLRQRNIVANNKDDLIIGFDDGTEVSLIEILESYHKGELKLFAISNVSNKRELLIAYDKWGGTEIDTTDLVYIDTFLEQK